MEAEPREGQGLPDAEVTVGERVSPDNADVLGDGRAVDREDEPGLKPLANVYRDPQRRTVSLLLDDETAEAAIYAVRVLIANLEAHAREARLVGAMLPPDSYGAANRHAIASRNELMARRLRRLEAHYRDLMITPGKGLEA